MSRASPAKSRFWKSPASCFLKITPARHVLYYLSNQAGILPGDHSITVNRASLPLSVKKTLARRSFPSNRGMAEIFRRGSRWSLVDIYGDIGIGSSFIPRCLFCLVQLRAFQCVSIAAGWMISPLQSLHWKAQPLTPGITVVNWQSLRSALAVRRSCLAE